jgi:hypothetical protein
MHRYHNAQGWAKGVFTVTEGQGELEKNPKGCSRGQALSPPYKQ